ncbi:hypothetical protein [Fonticella tunisiensis]|uniref:Uncharacterized protein n=1 Tax=Fonticella tunisiensis TaxID=1096341 RepID=A0A4R7KWQ2_9CLOT|nr:hypothetical protein [Fonticella tunisiensis]TDT63410.1 hypothetical protein EDD71_102172 [Fonticella tunisiensis]
MKNTLEGQITFDDLIKTSKIDEASKDLSRQAINELNEIGISGIVDYVDFRNVQAYVIFKNKFQCLPETLNLSYKSWCFWYGGGIYIYGRKFNLINTEYCGLVGTVRSRIEEIDKNRRAKVWIT